MNDFDNLHLVTAVDLSNDQPVDGKPVYHFVYASVLYGTLFAIYAKFKTEFNDAHDNCTISGVNLKLLNYQGVVNIGFTAHVMVHRPGSEVEKGKEMDEIFFGVQMGGSAEKDFTFPDAIEVGSKNHFPLKFSRLLYPMAGFEFDRERRDAQNVLEELPRQIPNTPYFDTEFQYRNGTGYYDSVLRPGMVEYDNLSIESLISCESGLAFPRCHQSLVNLFY
jgi:hypothetical protein